MLAGRGGDDVLRSMAARIRDVAAAIWGDRASRLCAIVGCVGLWLAVSFVDVSFLVLVFSSIAGLWYRARNGELAAPPEEEWF
jgi:hypothetical protein